MIRFAVIGLGRFGRRLAADLSEHGQKVVAVDVRPEVVEQIREVVTRAVCLDATEAKALKAHDIHKVETAVIAIGDHHFGTAVLITAALKELGVARVVARASEPLEARVLSRLGVDQIICPEEETAVRFAYQLANPDLFEYIALTEGHSLVQVKAPEQFHNKTLGQIDLRKKFSVNLVAIKKQVAATRSDGVQTHEEEIIDVPLADTVIRPDDILVLVGAVENLAKLPT